jgi:hypothetical protein
MPSFSYGQAGEKSTAEEKNPVEFQGESIPGTGRSNSTQRSVAIPLPATARDSQTNGFTRFKRSLAILAITTSCRLVHWQIASVLRTLARDSSYSYASHGISSPKVAARLRTLARDSNYSYPCIHYAYPCLRWESVYRVADPPS